MDNYWQNKYAGEYTVPTKTLNQQPTISDNVQIDIKTTDVNGNAIYPYRVDQVVIYFIERNFTSGAFNAYQENVGGQELTVYYTDAIPVKSFGDGANNPAWINTKPSEGYITYEPYDDNNIAQIGVFRLIWRPMAENGMAREGDYMICWKWTPLLSSPKQSAHISFILRGDQQATTASPAHVSPPGKYEALLNQYTPQMFTMLLAQNDMSPSVISRMNAAVGRGFGTLEDLINQILDLINANATHESLLPYLANFFKHKLWSNDPARWRGQIKNAMALNKQKGTLAGLTNALSSAGITLNKLTKYWQITSSSTWTETFVVGQGQTTFKLSKTAILPADPQNFVVSLRDVNGNTYVTLGLNYVSFSNVNNVTTMVWIGNLLSSGRVTLLTGDIIKVTYLVAPVVNQGIENYIRSLQLMDARDETTFTYPPKNWNVHLIAEDDVLFDMVIPQRLPFAAPTTWGKVRTEFAYSENIYNMEEYNGCASGETQVVTAKGLTKLKNLRSGEKILTEHGFRNFDYLVNQGKRKTIQLTTKMGRGLTVTSNHKFRVMSKEGLVWKSFDSMKIGDYILGKKGGINNFSTKNADLWYLAGFAYGDGNLFKDVMIWLVPSSEIESKANLTDILEQRGIKYNWRKRLKEEHQKNTQFECNEDQWILTSYRRQLPILGEILPSYEPKGKWKAHLPPSIWGAGEAQICAFLKGLFDTDGSVQKGSPVLTTKWKTLAEEVQSLLLLLGILSTVTSYQVTYKNEIRTYFRTRVIGAESIAKFIEKINFTLARKRNALENKWLSTNIKGDESTIFCSDRNVIPFADVIAREVFPTKRRMSKSSVKKRAKDEQRIITMISRLKQSQVKVIPDNQVHGILSKALEFGVKNKYRDLLEDYVRNDWFFDRVETISEGDEIEVFDPLNVKETASYISNGLVSHNSLRDSNYPCDIDRTFVDKCSACQSSSISLDLEMEDISNDRMSEAVEIVRGYIPFHAQVRSINYSSAINEYVPPPIEDIEILVQMNLNDYVIVAQGDFNRIIPNLGTNTGQFLRNQLSTAITMAVGSATAFNNEVVLYSPGVRFDHLNIYNINLLEILTGTNAGNYQVNVAAVGMGVIPIVSNSPSNIPFPLDTSAFTFRLSNLIWTDAAASIIQADVFNLSDTSVNFTLKTILTKTNSGTPWKISISSGVYTGTYNVKDVLPNNSLILDGWSGTATAINLSYSLVDNYGTTILSSSSGVVTVTRRGKVTTQELASWGVVEGDWILYSGTQYKISEFADVAKTQPYILDYTSGNASAVTITVYRRLLNNSTGYVDVRGMYMITTPNYESTLNIQNGSNHPTTPVETSSFMENYLVQIGSQYFAIIAWNANTITLSGPKNNWGLTGTSVSFSLINYMLTLPVVANDGAGFMDGVDRRGIESVTTKTSVVGMPLLDALNRPDGIVEAVNVEESISFTITNRKGKSIEGVIPCPKIA